MQEEAGDGSGGPLCHQDVDQCPGPGIVVEKPGDADNPPTAKRLPDGASQHKTAGPYAPVLEVEPGKLVVISGQAAINREGKVVGETIEQQAELTLENCLTQLRTAGCGAADSSSSGISAKCIV